MILPSFPREGFKHFCRHGLEQEFRHCFAGLPSADLIGALAPRRLQPFYLLLRGSRGQKTDLLCR